MINIDDRILVQLEPNELWLLIHIVKRLNKEHTAFPSKRTLLNDTRWKSEKTLASAMNALVSKGILSVTTRTREDGSQTSNLYRVMTSLIGVYKPANELQESVKNTVGGVQKIQGGGGQKIQPPRGKKIQGVGGKKCTPKEVLSNQVLNSEVLSNERVFSENEFSHDISNFNGIEIIDAEYHDLNSKETTPPVLRPTPPGADKTNVYLMYEAYCRFMEQKGYPISKNTTGNSYRMQPKDAKALKDWAAWAEGMPGAGSAVEDWTQFVQAAWATGDKWLKSNFTVSVLCSQKDRVMINANKAKQNELDIEAIINADPDEDPMAKYFR